MQVKKYQILQLIIKEEIMENLNVAESLPNKSVKKVYQAISNVANEIIANGGIAKEKPAKEKGKSIAYGAPDYAFRSIDQVYNALGPALVKHKLIILPRMIDRQVTERISSNGKTLFYVVVSGEFDFISTDDGSQVTIKTFGEAMDSGDKATNKAMSVAYKYAAFQAFCIPTEETIQDADTENHEVLPVSEQTQAKPVLTPTSKAWENAINSFIQNGNLDVVKKHAIVSPEIEQQIKDIAHTRTAQQPDDDIPL